MTKKLYIKQKIFNHLMVNGNKETGEKLFLKSLKALQKTSIKNNKKVIKISIINSSPIVNIKQVRLKKGKKKNIKEYPYVLNYKNRISLAIKYILDSVKRKDKLSLSFYNRLKQEIEDNSRKNGTAVKRKEDLQKHAILNKKYAYFRWF